MVLIPLFANDGNEQNRGCVSEVVPAGDAVVLGGGLAGLAAGYRLSQAGKRLTLLESAPAVGGLSQTLNHQGFLFDIGGHRFITKDKAIEELVLELLGEDVLEVPRRSQIHMLDRYFDYPLRPTNAAFGLGLSTTSAIIFDYCLERLKTFLGAQPPAVSLEDWVVRRFGRRMFELYFKQYSEKVWGIDCRQISMEWVAQRIKGLSLGAAIKNAFCRFRRSDLLTLADRFLYPKLGIGEISERLRQRIEASNPLWTSARAVAALHEDFRIKCIICQKGDRFFSLTADEFVSTLPLTNLVTMLDPAPPAEILQAARDRKSVV